MKPQNTPSSETEIHYKSKELGGQGKYEETGDQNEGTDSAIHGDSANGIVDGENYQSDISQPKTSEKSDENQAQESLNIDDNPENKK